MNISALASALASLSAGRSPLQPALDQLKKEADAARTHGPYSVMDKTRLPPSGDKHDYLSYGPYWWPDPTRADGLPFIRRDGEVFPESRNDATDSVRLHAMATETDMLSLAWYFTRDGTYADHAARLLRTWFLTPGTRMNPHLDYGQAIPGRCDGRGIGIIDTHTLPALLDAEMLLAGSPAWPEADHQALRDWMAAYLKWLLTSPNGLEEARQQNNHGTWYDVQVVSLALFTGDRQTAVKTLKDARKNRIEKQILPDGSQPKELSRTLSFSYSVMNLKAFFDLAELGDRAGVDLWQTPAGDSRGLRAALDFLAPFADPAKPWPHPQIKEANRLSLLPLLRQADHVYKDPAYANAIQQLPRESVRLNRSCLVTFP